MRAQLLPGGKKYAPYILPVLAIGLARTLTYTDWAAANASLAALLFAWLVADALALATIAKAPRFRPGLKPIMGALAIGSVVAMVGAAAPVRSALLQMPPLLAAMGATIAIYFAWSFIGAVREWAASRSLEAAASHFLPARLVKMLFAELRMMHLAVFRWNAPVDVPQGAQAFFYHRYLTPMIATLLALQVIELVVVHFLVSLWSETAAFILLALSLAGVLWLIALLKSFRIMPVLLDEDGLRVRSGAVVDAWIPRAAIAGPVACFDADTLKKKSTLNTAILSSPNICLTLSRPVEVPTFFGGKKSIERIAMRLEEPVRFLDALDQRGD